MAIITWKDKHPLDEQELLSSTVQFQTLEICHSQLADDASPAYATLHTIGITSSLVATKAQSYQRSCPNLLMLLISSILIPPL